MIDHYGGQVSNRPHSHTTSLVQIMLVNNILTAQGDVYMFISIRMIVQ